MTIVPVFNLAGKRVFVAGHKGMVGSAIIRRLQTEDVTILTADRSEVDLTDQSAVRNWMKRNRPEVVFLAAAKVGGILANASFPAQFLYENLMIEANVIDSAWHSGAQKLIFFGSTCIYPKFAKQPILEDSLLTGPLEQTNEWYAIAKIAGVKLCQAYRKQYNSDFISVQPTNLYGPGDNYDLHNSHVLPALIRKAHEAKRNNAAELVVWGSGNPLREFLHVDDLADAAVYLSKKYSGISPVNVGSGEEISIADLARSVCNTVGFNGTVIFDSSKPDGTPRKLADSSLLKRIGWNNPRPLADGIKATYQELIDNEFTDF